VKGLLYFVVQQVEDKIKKSRSRGFFFVQKITGRLSVGRYYTWPFRCVAQIDLWRRGSRGEKWLFFAHTTLFRSRSPGYASSKSFCVDKNSQFSLAITHRNKPDKQTL
jgi:hypothetical protein